MSVLEQKDELIDKPTSASLTERVERANALEPVKDYPLAATSISNFVTRGIPTPEAADDVAEVKDPQAALDRKNAKNDANRKAGVVPQKKA